MSYFSPKPKQKPKRLPRRRPIKAAPSGIGDQGIVGNWLFYYLKGGDHLHDFSPYGNHGTINGAKWFDGSFGWALDFDGVDDYVDCGDVSPDDYITVMAWGKLDDLESADDVNDLVTHDNAANTGFGIKYHVTDAYGHLEEMQLVVGDGTNWYDLYISAPNITGEWHHWALTYSKDTGDLKAYLDGELKKTDNINISTGFAGTTTKIGRRGGVDERYWDGPIAIVRIYSVAKSDNWISKRFQKTKSIFGL